MRYGLKAVLRLQILFLQYLQFADSFDVKVLVDVPVQEQILVHLHIGNNTLELHQEFGNFGNNEHFKKNKSTDAADGIT